MMSRYYYDLHIHSCLSPCADNDMTPNNIAGMATLAGLNIVALTDHNSCKNCPAFFKACENNGIIPIAGMELTTAEDIHMICLFSSLKNAMAFDCEIESRRIKIKNKTEIFGDQLILDENDEQIGTDEFLLPNATTVSIDEGFEMVKKHGGIAYPAHIDREANGIVAVLGVFPDEPAFMAAEIRDKQNIEKYCNRFPILKSKKFVVCSDAHYLTDIPDKSNYFEFEAASDEQIRKNILACLNQGAV